MVSSDSAGPSEPTAGDQVGERYQLIEELGRGAMGAVWRAHDSALDVPCALKFMLDEHARLQELRERFHREARVAARLRSPHTVRVTDVSEWQGRPYLVMELLQGEDLESRLQREGRLSPELTVEIVEQVARGLQSAHDAALVHRDLKPENIFLQVGDPVHAKVLDFGVAKKLDAASGVRTALGTLIGTPQYMSPEQASGDTNLDYRADLWSLAVVTYRCLTGRTPFDGESLASLLVAILTAEIPPLATASNGLPETLNTVWYKAATRDPHARHGSALEFAAALRSALSERLAPPPGFTVRQAVPTEVQEASTAFGKECLSDLIPAGVPRRPPRTFWIGIGLGSGFGLLLLLGLNQHQSRSNPEPVHEVRPSPITASSGGPAASHTPEAAAHPAEGALPQPERDQPRALDLEPPGGAPRVETVKSAPLSSQGAAAADTPPKAQPARRAAETRPKASAETTAETKPARSAATGASAVNRGLPETKPRDDKPAPTPKAPPAAAIEPAAATPQAPLATPAAAPAPTVPKDDPTDDRLGF